MQMTPDRVLEAVCRNQRFVAEYMEDAADSECVAGSRNAHIGGCRQRFNELALLGFSGGVHPFTRCHQNAARTPK